MESGRKGDSGDGAGAHVEITQEPHTRRREATLPAVAAAAVGVGRAGEDKDGKDEPDRYDNLESMLPHTHCHLTMNESTEGLELPS